MSKVKTSMQYLERDFDICLGVITSASGVKGYVKIKSFAESSYDFEYFSSLFDEMGSTYKINKIISAKRDCVIASIEGINSRNQAEKLRNVKLYIKRSELPPLGKEEYYHADLIGLNAVYSDGSPLGIIKNIMNFGAGDILEIYDATTEKIIYYPFNKQYVPEINFGENKIIVNPLEELVVAPE